MDYGPMQSAAQVRQVSLQRAGLLTLLPANTSQRVIANNAEKTQQKTKKHSEKQKGSYAWPTWIACEDW